MVIRNSTMVVPLDREVDMMRYWSGVYNSPEQSSWLRVGSNVSVWEVRRGGGRAAAAWQEGGGGGELHSCCHGWMVMLAYCATLTAREQYTAIQ